MAKKLEANGLWESSRMMLPEHKDVTRRQAKQTDRLVKPTLDDQEVEIISTVLFQSHRNQKVVRLTLYGEYDLRSVTGIVTCTQRDSFRLDTEDPFTGVADGSGLCFGM
ncbi:YolD-like family protein [Paenibacillus sp. GP183]|uniref:YolD-like family protein n=1 Tax=Paenibacillus sp. GP183 TaxID=1882751 RepID=UPI00089B47E5|nr:YolD-like family protein [Paenibacillus sp. GP183]SEC43335.1 YolD-like protein [Paenibacillus sp. GP183]